MTVSLYIPLRSDITQVIATFLLLKFTLYPTTFRYNLGISKSEYEKVRTLYPTTFRYNSFSDVVSSSKSTLYPTTFRYNIPNFLLYILLMLPLYIPLRSDIT